MPRNEFKAGDNHSHGDTETCRHCLRQIEWVNTQIDEFWTHTHSGIQACSVFKAGVWAEPADHPGKGEEEDLSQEESPVEENPDRMDALVSGLKALADLRKEPGLTTTEAHRKTRPVLPPED